MTERDRATALYGRSRERAALDELLEAIRGGESRSLMLRGEAGIGKTALLDYLVGGASDLTIVRAEGVESEMELAYASLHQLCAQLPDRLASLPAPQRDALRVAFGLTAGLSPDRFLVGLAVLSLMSEVAEERPLLCVVDDAQWLDQASALTLAFVARRLLAEPLGLVFAARDPGDALVHVPALALDGLRNGEAQALLASSLPFMLDERVRDRIVAEAHGNPLAMLELPRGLTSTELTAGLGIAGTRPLPERIEQSFVRRLEALPGDARRLLLVAAAEPLGDPLLFWRAASQLGIDVGVAKAIETEGLLAIDERVTFRHPLVRSAIYRSQPLDDRRDVHRALAGATDRETDPDRRAWHLAAAVAGPDEEVAQELELSAVRARARGGQAAAAAFLARSVELTREPARRAQRALAAAEAKRLAGSGEEALQLAALAEAGPLDEAERVRVAVLRGRVATMQRRPRDAPPLLLGAARRLEPFDRRTARDTYRDAFIATFYAGRCGGDTGLPEVAAAVRSAAPASEPSSVTDDLLDAAALLVDAGWATGAPAVQRALSEFCISLASQKFELHWLFLAGRLSMWVWEEEKVDALTSRALALVHEEGILALVPFAAAHRVAWDLFAGDLSSASAHVDEQDTIQEAIGGERSPGSRIALAAHRGREAEVAQLREATTADAVARGDGIWVTLLHWSTAVLCNGLGRYREALTAAQLGAAYPPDMHVASWALGELVEAAARCGEPEAADDALARLAEMARACGTNWVLGVEARARALVAQPGEADELYRQALDHLGRTRLRTELARTHLVYGEWLRRDRRRLDARDQLRRAQDIFSAIGAEAFAARAGRELLATGETARKRTSETRDELTAQETQIAQLARDGLSNPEIGARLFLSPRTVEYHLHKVFNKLAITSREHLDRVLPDD